jgi:uncharacterized 2Fe-2S/4Fe-4S cluster protein (DUF4445 family)
VSVVLEFNKEKISSSTGSTLYECLRQAGITLPSSCNGSGRCGECRVIIEKGEGLLSPRTTPELHMVSGQRLACQARIIKESGLIRCFSGMYDQQRIEESGSRVAGDSAGLDPSVQVSGDEVWMDGRILKKSFGKDVYGAALDIGTSTVVLKLADLKTGEIISTDSFVNPQFFAGSDAISRISYISEKGSAALQQSLVQKINRIFAGLKIPNGSIYEIVVAGNPVMRDIFFGFDVRGLGQQPFQSIAEIEQKAGKRESTSVDLPPLAIGIEINSQGRIYGLPFPGCHVGGDISAGILASGLAWDDRNIVFLDLGTNSEIVVKSGDRIVAASCPAGPAFEGGCIKCGMPGLPGAVEAVRIFSDSTIRMEVIGGGIPAGFCGSGLISLLGEMFESGLISRRGRFLEDAESKCRDPELLESFDDALVDNKELSSFPVRSFFIENPDAGPKKLVVNGPEGLFIDEEDISQLLQAKAAITAGLRIALRNCDMQMEDIERFYLAGAFGRYLNLDSAAKIGFLPKLDEGSFYRLGNSSIEGATMALLSLVSRRKIEEAVKNITHLELETEPDFFELYTDGCLLGEI